MEFWAELSGVQLSDSADEPTWIQALPLNEYTHPLHGKIKITPERAQRFADNVKANVRGQELDIDYDHKAKRDDAAGWVKDAEARLNETDPKKNGLWLAVSWTQEARQKIKDKAYRYFSSEFKDEWTHPSTNATFKDVLFGGGLTNRPFLKDILPINLSELTEENPKEGSTVSKELKDKLELPETATDEEVLAAVSKLQENSASTEETPKPDEADKQPAELSEGEQELKKLAETDPIVKLLLDERDAAKARDEETRRELAEIRKGQTKRSTEIRLSEITKDAKYTLPPAVIEEVTSLSEDDSLTATQLSDKMFDILGTIAKSGVVELGERGKAKKPDTDATKRLDDAIKQHMKDNNVDYAKALSEVTTADPSLYENYHNELIEA